MALDRRTIMGLTERFGVENALLVNEMIENVRNRANAPSDYSQLGNLPPLTVQAEKSGPTKDGGMSFA